MKKLIFAALTLFSVVSKAQDKFIINGALPDAASGSKILLSYVNSQGKDTVDSAELVNGRFSITGYTAYGNKAYLDLRPVNPKNGSYGGDYKEFYLEKGTTMLMGKDSVATASITGTKTQAENLAFHDKFDPLQAEYKRIVARYFKATAAKDSLELKRIAIDARPVVDKMQSVMNEFIASRPDSYVTADLVFLNKMDVIDVVKFEPIYNALTKRVLSSFTGQKIAEKFSKAKEFAVGKKIDFTLPDATGVPFELSSLKGKYVLVDFWASWCVPCRAENPYLLQAYNELKDKNFEIVSVSLDDKRANWLAAVAADKMPWKQVSDVKGFKTEIAIRFGITAIPQNVLLDQDGKVIGKDLRGKNVNKLISAYIK